MHPGHVHEKFLLPPPTHTHTEKMLPIQWWAINDSGTCLICLLSDLGKFPILFNKYKFIFVLYNQLSFSMDIVTYLLTFLKSLKIYCCWFLIFISPIELGQESSTLGPLRYSFPQRTCRVQLSLVIKLFWNFSIP